MYYVYMLECADGTLYTGWTPDLNKRIEQHSSGRGSKYVRSRLPFHLRYTESFSTKSAAMRREYALKQLTRNEKLALIDDQHASLQHKDK